MAAPIYTIEDIKGGKAVLVEGANKLEVDQMELPKAAAPGVKVKMRCGKYCVVKDEA